jgi:glycosyltransferase involved in cell wall biosynthesis
VSARPPSVVVAATQVPFQRGGAEWHADALARAFAARGFEAELVRLPFQWDPRREVVRSALAWRLLDLRHADGRPVELVVATRFPSYAVRHPNKVLWLFHPFRQAYDLHDAGKDGFADDPEGRALLQAVRDLDRRLLVECRRVFTTSANNARRLERYAGVSAEVLKLPLAEDGGWRCEAPEPFVLSVGRLESLKRTELLVRAAVHLPASARVVVVGEGKQRGALEALAGELGVAGRVEFRGRASDEEVRALYARCGAVFYAPWDEDYGLVTLEAFKSGKPVVTTHDAGGPLEFVADGVNGFVTPPEPAAIAQALERLLADPALASRLGAAGARSIEGISWDAVVAALSATLPASGRRP